MRLGLLPILLTLWLGTASFAAPVANPDIEIPAPKGESFEALCFSPENRYVFTVTRQGKRKLFLDRWELKTKKRTRLARAFRGWELYLDWDARLKGIRIADENRVLWRSPETGNVLAELRQDEKLPGIRYQEWKDGNRVRSIYTPCKSPHFSRIVDTQVAMRRHLETGWHFVDFLDGTKKYLAAPSDQSETVVTFTKSGDGKTLLGSTWTSDPGYRTMMWLWDAKTAKLRRPLKYVSQHSSAGQDNLVSLNHDGTELITTPELLSPNIYVIDTKSGKLTRKIRTGAPLFLRASPTQNIFAAYLDGVEFWSLRTGKRLVEYVDNPVEEEGDDIAHAFSPDGSHFAWGWKVIHIVKVPKDE